MCVCESVCVCVCVCNRFIPFMREIQHCHPVCVYQSYLVNHIRSVGCGENRDIFKLLDSVHLCQQLS